MALEDAIRELARAVATNEEGRAVAEIIRQRDTWQKESDRLRTDRDYWKMRKEEIEKDNLRMGRVISSLRGVITRMKKKAQEA